MSEPHFVTMGRLDQIYTTSWQKTNFHEKLPTNNPICKSHLIIIIIIIIIGHTHNTMTLRHHKSILTLDCNYGRKLTHRLLTIAELLLVQYAITITLCVHLCSGEPCSGIMSQLDRTDRLDWSDRLHWSDQLDRSNTTWKKTSVKQRLHSVSPSGY